MYKMDNCLKKHFAHKDEVFKGMMAQTREENKLNCILCASGADIQ